MKSSSLCIVLCTCLLACLFASVNSETLTLTPQNINEWWFQFQASKSLDTLKVTCGSTTTQLTKESWGWSNSPTAVCQLGSALQFEGTLSGGTCKGSGTFGQTVTLTITTVTSPPPAVGTNTIVFTPQSSNTWWFQFKLSRKVDSVAVKCGTTTTHLKQEAWGWMNSPSAQCAYNTMIKIEGVVEGKSYSGSGPYGKEITATISSTISPAPPATSTVSATVNIADGRTFSDLIFGVNFAEERHFANVPYTINRKGGNSETTYNWEQGIKNSGSDWVYISSPETLNVTKLPEGTSLTTHVDVSRKRKSEVILTSTLIGYAVADTREKKWSYSVAKYGQQQSTECTLSNGASWCQADAGNGIRRDGSKIVDNNPLDTYKKIDETYTTRLIKFLNQRKTPVKYWSLDNEWDLWHETHRDIHPKKGTYQEIVRLSIKYATAIKKAQPDAITMGPAAWGFCGYYFSPADDCKIGADRKANGNVPFIEYYLRNLAESKTATGVNVIDYLDIHYYPQTSGVYGGKDDSATQEARLRSVKSLYDRNYKDESWIATTGDESLKKIYLIPRMKEYIAKYYPSLKLAITEYNFGNDELVSSALAQVDVLGIFAREGVDMACRWGAPNVGTPVETAFKLYLNYDGKGARVRGNVVKAVSDNVDKLGTHAFYDKADGSLYVILINKATSATAAKVTISGVSSKVGSMYQFSESIPVLRLDAVKPAINGNGLLTVDLRARSASLVVFNTKTSTTAVTVLSDAPTLGWQDYQQQAIALDQMYDTPAQPKETETAQKSKKGWIIGGSVIGGVSVITLVIVFTIAALVITRTMVAKRTHNHPDVLYARIDSE